MASPRLEGEVLLLDRAFEVLDGDLVSVAQDGDALVAGNVDQYAAGHQHADLLDAELGEAVARRDVLGLEAIVVHVVVGLVGEAVELRADLSHLGDDQLLVAVALVGEVAHRGALDLHIVHAPGRERHLGIERMAELDHLSALDQLGGIEDSPAVSCGWPRRARRRRPIWTDSARCLPAAAKRAFETASGQRRWRSAAGSQAWC